MSISLNATLGYESLARGNKTFFLNVNDRDLDCKSFLQFGYPENLPAEGYFWTNKLIKDEFLNKIEVCVRVLDLLSIQVFLFLFFHQRLSYI